MCRSASKKGFFRPSTLGNTLEVVVLLARTTILEIVRAKGVTGMIEGEA